MSEKIVREWHFYLDGMIEFSEKVISYSEDFDQAGFVDSESLR